MGNSNSGGNQIIDDKTQHDDSSTVSLNGSGANLKEKLNTSWKFSTLSNEENESYNFKATGAANEKKKLIIADDEDDDENYGSTCEDNDDDEEVATVKNQMNLNSILHIDEHGEDDYDGIGYQQIHQGYHNLSTSSASGSTGSTSASASPEQPLPEQQQQQNERANDTIENLAFSLLNKLTFDTAAAVGACADQIPIATSLLAVPCEPVPPPCTPVSATLAIPVNGDAAGQSIIEKLLNGSGMNINKPQLIIDDVLLMSHEDGRPVAPLVEPEESFNASKIAEEPEPNEDDALIKQASTTPTAEQKPQEERSTAFMMLINKIAPHSHLIEHNFEFQVNSAKELEHIHDVKLTGSFNNWQQFLPMVRDAKCKAKWHKSLMLAPGEYEYKFVVNDQDWRCNTNMPVSIDGLNNLLNLTKN